MITLEEHSQSGGSIQPLENVDAICSWQGKRIENASGWGVAVQRRCSDRNDAKLGPPTSTRSALASKG